MQDETKALLDTLLAEPTLEAATGTGSERDARNAFTAMKRGQLRMLLNEFGYKLPENPETTRLLASYIVEREHYNRKGDAARVERITARLAECVRRRNVNLLTAKDEDTMTEETAVSNDATETKPRKGTKKGAGKKAAKKATKGTSAKKATKKAKKADAAEGATGTRYANDERKIKLLSKENPHREGTGRYNAFEAVRTSKTVADYAATGNKPKYLAAWEGAGLISLG